MTLGKFRQRAIRVLEIHTRPLLVSAVKQVLQGNFETVIHHVPRSLFEWRLQIANPLIRPMLDQLKALHSKNDTPKKIRNFPATAANAAHSWERGMNRDKLLQNFARFPIDG